MSIYDPKSRVAAEFISDEEIRETLAYADAHKNDAELIDQLLEKARPVKKGKGYTCRGLTHQEDGSLPMGLRGGLEKAVKVDEVIVCTGSAANTDIGLENAGVDFDKSGVKVNEYMQTNVKHIYAAGDITGGHSSADRAILQAEYAAGNISGHKRERIYEDSLVRTIKCIPESAVVGKTEDDCLRRDLHFKKVTLPLGEVAKSNISDFADGFIKLLCEKNGKIIGATVMAPHAALIIQEISLAMHAGLDAKALAEAPHQHYEWSELVREAAKQMF